jgi:hypothetical protein
VDIESNQPKNNRIGAATDLRGDEDVGVDANGAQPPQRVEAPVGLRRLVLPGNRVGRLLGRLERLQELPLHGGRLGKIKTLAPRRRLSLNLLCGVEPWRRAEGKGVRFGGGRQLYSGRQAAIRTRR